jgi:hypothetical protein
LLILSEKRIGFRYVSILIRLAVFLASGRACMKLVPLREIDVGQASEPEG